MTVRDWKAFDKRTFAVTKKGHFTNEQDNVGKVPLQVAARVQSIEAPRGQGDRGDRDAGSNQVLVADAEQFPCPEVQSYGMSRSQKPKGHRRLFPGGNRVSGCSMRRGPYRLPIR